MSATIKLDKRALQALQADWELNKKSYVKVGILANAAPRQAEPGKIDNNVDLGAVHELGDPSAEPPVPRRSFLKRPIMDRLPLRINQMGPDVWRKAILEKGVLFALAVLGVEAENIVQGGFTSGGYGNWKELSPFTIEKKKKLGRSLNILIESAQMSKAVHSAVVKK